MTTAKPFNIADVLSITTGRLVSWQGIGGVYTILNHMTGDNLRHPSTRACGGSLQAGVAG